MRGSPIGTWQYAKAGNIPTFEMKKTEWKSKWPGYTNDLADCDKLILTQAYCPLPPLPQAPSPPYPK